MSNGQMMQNVNVTQPPKQEIPQGPGALQKAQLSNGQAQPSGQRPQSLSP